MPRPIKDEYDWKVYTQDYSNQVKEMKKTAGDNGSEFLVNKWEIKDSELKLYDKLHGNWRAIYSTIFNLKPQSVFECGCGGMYHLKNIKTLFPNIDVHGCDLLKSQIDFGKEAFNIGERILKNVKVIDFTKQDATDNLGRYDFVFSHAVMMHLSHDRALNFMRNMFTIATKYIYFIEGQQHNYEELLSIIGKKDKVILSRPPAYNSWLLTIK